MNDINQLYELWLHNTKDDSETHSELETIRGNEKEILERFHKNLHFGSLMHCSLFRTSASGI